MLSNVSHTIECIAPITSDDDPDLAALYSRQAYFDDRHQQALGELSSLPRCDTPWLSSSFYPISSGPACSDDQKANLLAITLKDNFTENERPNGDYPIDNTITTTLENFSLTPTPSHYPY
ncbi:hypothetical protein TNCV_2060611 [Trichonephila clavipes]|nr:hypothetical protein TNCV_2060611 [Trichonephila clavipes]